MLLLEGQSVVITGAGSGVGRAAALIFTRHGARVVCADIVPDRIEETVALVRAEGGEAVGVVCDVASEPDVEAAVKLAVASFGRLDVMFNNAGISSVQDGKRMSLHTNTVDDYERLSSINFKGAFLGCKHALLQFREQDDRKGVIVNTASIAGLVALGGVLYQATKAAVIQLTRGVAIEAAPLGVRCNAVCPGGMITNFGVTQDREITQDLVDKYAKPHPLGRVITPEETANAALFLASDLASNITGVALPVDGGYVAA